MRQATNACLLVALSCASSAFVAPSTRGSAIHSCRRHSSSPLPRWRHTPVLCVDEGAAVADPPSAAPRFGRGDGGGGRGRGRGKSMELKNPMYLKRKAPVIPQGGGGRDQQRDAPRERTREFGPPASPSGSFKPSGPPSDDGDDGDGPSRDGPRRGSGAPVRRLNKKPEGRGGMSDSEGPRGKGAGKKSRQGAGDDFSRPMAMARAPRKKGKRGKANPVNAPPPPPVGRRR